MDSLPVVSYFICATPRSGSTLLCEALRNTGLAGNPDEYFGSMHVDRWRITWNIDSDQLYIQKVLQYGSGWNGVWGAKLMRLYWQEFVSQLQAVSDAANLSEIELLDKFFPERKYIFITRRNKVRQAVSWLKFIQGTAWYWEQKEPQKLDTLEYKPDVIDAFLQQTAKHESAWLEFFAQTETELFIVVYEDFVKAYEETAVAILDYLGVDYPHPLTFAERKMQKQADTLSDEWVQKYLNSTK
jgi:trehalose 2-sulfotransferase